MDNPLLNQGPLPNFSQISPEYIEPAIKQIITQNRADISDILKNNNEYTWDNLMLPLEEIGDRLSKVWSPVAHMHAVVETEPLRAAYNACLPLLTEYQAELLQNEELFKAVRSLTRESEYAKLDETQRKIIEHDLRDFKLAGVDLSSIDKARYVELQKQMSQQSTKFGENLLDATQNWVLPITDINALKGLPEQVIKMLEQNAQAREQKGWLITLEYPCYSAAIKYLENRELRWLLYEAYSTRASDQGPHASRWDNSPIIDNILKLRYEMANLLNFKHYSDYSLATKMADTPERVLSFLHDLVVRARKSGEKEMQELREFAKATDNLDEVEAWDLPYYTEKLRLAKYALQQEDLRPYFPIHKVMEGMFTIINKIYGLTIKERNGIDTWHPQVQFFDVYDAENNLRGSFYTDLYARPHKREGAWMDDCRVRRKLADGSLQTPIAFLTCNFNRPLGLQSALLTHEEVITLFHEFGHCLHHIVTQVDYASAAGINGVPWDAVEFPSQFLEHWCWEKDALALMSEHVDTKEPLPDTLYNKMIAAKNFQPAMHILRQLEFAIFDFRLHSQYDPNQTISVQDLLDEVRKEVSVVKVPRFNRFQNSFAHIFAGGYAAGYYSYLWAEVLSSDAYSKFEETGIFNHETGRSFMTNILEKGGSRNPMELFVAFRGREPTIDALLRHNGLQ